MKATFIKGIIGALNLIIMLTLVSAPTMELKAQSDGDINFLNKRWEEIIAWVGEDFNYDFVAKINPDSGLDTNLAIRYELIDHPATPEDLTLDPVTGSISWIPDQRGIAGVFCKAYIMTMPEVETMVDIYIQVRDRSNYDVCAAVSGRITTMDGEPLADANVEMVNFDSHYEDGMTLPDEPYGGTTDADGNYSIEVPEGRYVYRVSKQSPAGSMMPYIYMYEMRKPVAVECDETIEHNLEVRRYNEIQIYRNNSQIVLHPGDQYACVVEASDWYNSKIDLELMESPQGMQFNGNTGEISWTPSQTGRYQYIIRGSIEGQEDYQDVVFELAVVEEDPDFCAEINGRITDMDGNPISGAMISAMSYDFYGLVGGEELYDDPLAGYTNDNGYYTISVPEDDYIVYVGASNHNGEFYPNTYYFEDAEPVAAECGTPGTANFELYHFPDNPTHQVTGRVVSSVDGTPVPAYVEFIFADRDAHPELTPYQMIGGAGRTDMNGNYTAMAMEGYEFKIVAKPEVPGFMNEYYNETMNWEDAQVVTVDSDMSGIDFTVSPRGDFENSFGGKVIDENGDPVFASLLLFRHDGNGDFVENEITTTDLDSGKYEFSNVVPGKYAVMAMPHNGRHFYGFYNESGICENLFKANIITIDEDDVLLNDHIITLRVVGYNDGKGLFWGNVADESDLSALKHVRVDAYIDGQPAAYDFSSKEGMFKLQNLPEGDYRVVFSKPGYENAEVEVTIDEDGQIETRRDVTLRPTAINSVEDGNAIAPQYVYPNPAQSVTTAIFNASAGRADLTVYSIEGRVKISRTVELGEGTNSLSVDLDGLEPGAYFLRIAGSKVFMNAKFEVVK